METVYWLDDASINELSDNVDNNVQNYMTGNFDDFFEKRKQRLRDVGVKIDLNIIKGLSGRSKDEAEDSCKIFSAITGVTSSLAAWPNFWAYLSHTHLLQYGRKRWLSSQDKTQNKIKDHFVLLSPGRLRDDHTSSRPWWMAQIASKIAQSDDLGEIEKVLKIFARTTDTRSQSYERPSVFGDVDLARLLMQKIQKTPSLANEKEFREFMVRINFTTNGYKFSEMSYDDFDKNFG